ncbi:unnamed protein product [Caenorhabditis angaria]|uniref:Kazal-like domain-containing protein n=1 Tax=Caenorhabditis angaria TaxID=860376 RepID=A0A9P1N8Z6_9PELO|nr:unnamed protein product [Caenorhabditis angaria]
MLFILYLIFFYSISLGLCDSCDCPDVIRPVCGTDNVTYDNLCVFRCAQNIDKDLMFFYNGTCCSQTLCDPRIETPLCDNFGKTHINECTFLKYRCLMQKSMGLSLEKLYDGPCQNKKCSSKYECSQQYDPVCDNNGEIYINICLFEKRKCELETMNKVIILAEDQKSCTSRQRQKMAGVEFYTYSSYVDDEQTKEELVSIANSTTTIIPPLTTTSKSDQKIVFRDSNGQTPTQFNQKCSLSECEKTWNPVCDSRNRTHKNVCHFKYYACKVNEINGSSIDIANIGACVTNKNVCATCPKEEPMIPVCDNRNMTHPTLCSFIQFNCEARNKHEDERVLVHIKSCHQRSPQFDLKEEICPKMCSRDLKPVCDEANNTHQNLCHFQQYNCNMRKLGIHAPYLRYLRPCITRKLDFAVENIEIQATVSNVQMVMQTTPSEKTTFIVSTPERVKSTETSTTTISTTTESEAFFDCPKPNCPTDGQPVCDSKGNLHGNLCEFTYSRCLAATIGEQLHIANEDNCVSKEACQMPCTDEKHHICASDFSTYDNLCQFRKQKCLDTELEVLFKGKCNECLDSPCAHPPFDAPDDSFVCLEDGSTKSLCEYQMLSCIFERGYGLNLTVQYIGKCCERVETCDEEKTDPICASNNVTYLTECEMNIENCKFRKLDLPLLTVERRGICERSQEISMDKLQSEFKRENLFDCKTECDNSYEPLCGTNGVTYTNPCSLQKELCMEGSGRVEIAYTGMCCDTNCPNDFSPVCDDQGKTHQNICHFGVNRCILERSLGSLLSIEKFGICTDVKECAIECPKEYSPVCSTNGQNIINECELDKINCLLSHNITIGELLVKDYDGECCRSENCDITEFSPVCDTDGITHSNLCLMEKHACVQNKKFGKNVTVLYNGQCCAQRCENITEPVCDGNTTYSNVCEFKIAQCEAHRINKTLTISYNGQCCPFETSGECSTSGPLCDSDGQTHNSHCHYQQKKCIEERVSGKTLNVVHTGECCSLAVCPKSGQYVCDSMGRTHDSICHFHNAKCIYDKIHKTNNTLNLHYQGKCCPAGCTDELSVTCDQHGNVYRNVCYFNLKACETWRRTQEVLLATPCPLLRT